MKWRSAWHMDLGGSGGALFGVPALALFLPAYLAVGSADWVEWVKAFVVDGSSGDWPAAAAESALYLLRHVALLVAISKFALEWDLE